jgi:hypothetical protein
MTLGARGHRDRGPHAAITVGHSAIVAACFWGLGYFLRIVSSHLCSPPTVKKSKFVLIEMRKFVGGSITLVQLGNGEVLVVNVNGTLENLPANHEATKLMVERLGVVRASIVNGDFFVGDDDELKAHILSLGPNPKVNPLVGNVLHCRLSQVD